MLGDVARWLRILGEDCVYADSSWSDDEVVARAEREGRVLVTRDVALAERALRAGLGVVATSAMDVEAVLAEVYGWTGLRPEAARLATRCSLCNGSLVPTDVRAATERAVARGKEPPRPEVAGRHGRFWSCSACGQAYWRGTHWETIEALRVRLVARLT